MLEFSSDVQKQLKAYERNKMVTWVDPRPDNIPQYLGPGIGE